MNNKEVSKELNISVDEFYQCMNTNQKNFSYYKKNNMNRYNDSITAGIVNHFKIDHEELIAMIKLYKMQQTSK